MKKAIPYLLIVILFIVALFVRQCREGRAPEKSSRASSGTHHSTEKDSSRVADVFRDAEATYFFTKHARCRMDCRHITQKEVKEIVRKAEVNYTKSDLNDPKGATYALEGYTSKDRQHVRIIVAPKQKHLSIVTVIDLDKEWECPNCN